jgi:methyl-accepting chemotaxis protein
MSFFSKIKNPPMQLTNVLMEKKMNFNKLSLKKKIISTFVALILIFMLVLAFLLNSQNKLGGMQDQGAERFKAAQQISHTVSEVAEVYSVSADAVINHDLVQTKKDLIEIKNNMAKSTAEIEKLADTAEEKKWAEEFKTNYIKYVDMIEKDMVPELEKFDGINPKIREIDGKIDKIREETLAPLKLYLTSLEKESAESDKVFDSTFKEGIRVSIIASVIVTLVALFFAFTLASNIGKILANIKEEITKAFQTIAENAEKVAAAAGNLSEATTEQASAIQETSASMEEMTSMIKKTADSATESTRLSRSSAQNAIKGKETSEHLMNSVKEIETNNKQIMTEVERGNVRIGEIVTLINEIGNKTKVINDIVFQTKLLSFNASVEAARAGEQGKGFAVVAEEVGNLAQMSGKAAQEISEMLDDSTKKVQTVIDETQRSVGAILSKGNAVVLEGLSVSGQNADILKIIDSDVKSVDANIMEISVASDEQARGAEQVAQALHQLDQTTQMNSNLSQQLFEYSKGLTGQTENLKQAVYTLEKIVEGE